MTTPCEIVIYSKNKELATNIVKELLLHTKELEKKYNYFNKSSLVSQINNREMTSLDTQTKELLQKAKIFYKSTLKSFDITVATLKPLFQSQNLDIFEDEKSKLTPYVGCEHFEIKKNKIIFDNQYTKIDLGGMVKEFAVDEAVKILMKNKITSALINFGGDIYALGTKPTGEQFRVGIKNPSNPMEHITSIELCNMALTTSAHYERDYKIESKTFSHIINPKDFSSDIISATVISSNTLISGVFSTAILCNSQIKSKHKTIKINTHKELFYENFNS